MVVVLPSGAMESGEAWRRPASASVGGDGLHVEIAAGGCLQRPNRIIVYPDGNRCIWWLQFEAKVTVGSWA